MIKRSGGPKCNDKFYAHFSTLLLEPTKKRNGRRRVWRLRDPFSVTIHCPGGGVAITIPAGYETDFASMPVASQIFLGNRDDFLMASVVHDWCCSNSMPSWWSNSLMRTVMELSQHPRWKVLAIFYTLQFFGYGSAVFNFFTLGVFKRDAQVQ